MRVVVAGAGGHARSVIEALRAGGAHEPAACTDPRPEMIGRELDGVPVVGSDSELERLRASGVGGAVVGLGGTGDNRRRAMLFHELAELGFELPAIVHPSAVIASTARVGAGSVVLAGAILGAGTRVDRNVIVNNGAVVDHDCELADHSHVATGAALAGGVLVGEGAHVGVGACVMQGVLIGARAVAGAGAVVIRDVPEGVIVAGSPASALGTAQ